MISFVIFMCFDVEKHPNGVPPCVFTRTLLHPRYHIWLQPTRSSPYVSSSMVGNDKEGYQA